jgi:CheY-like chemotaxis protein
VERTDLDDNNKQKILVIEDEPFICLVCEKTLASEGYEVDIAENGLMALELTSKKNYDLIFSDVRTPKMNGIEFYRQIKQQDPGLAERIIFTSGDVMSPDVKDFLSKNQNQFLAKPFMPRELREIVKKTLSKTNEPSIS